MMTTSDSRNLTFRDSSQKNQTKVTDFLKKTDKNEKINNNRWGIHVQLDNVNDTRVVKFENVPENDSDLNLQNGVEIFKIQEPQYLMDSEQIKIMKFPEEEVSNSPSGEEPGVLENSSAFFLSLVSKYKSEVQDLTDIKFTVNKSIESQIEKLQVKISDIERVLGIQSDEDILGIQSDEDITLESDMGAVEHNVTVQSVEIPFAMGNQVSIKTKTHKIILKTLLTHDVSKCKY